MSDRGGTRILILGRERQRVAAAQRFLEENGIPAVGVSGDDEVVAELDSGEFTAVMIGGGVSPAGRELVKEHAAPHGTEVIEAHPGPGQTVQDYLRESVVPRFSASNGSAAATAGREGLGRPEHDRSGETIDEAVEKAEAGSQVEGVHTPSGQAESGDSRVERMVDVEERSTEATGTEGSGTTIPPGPTPTDVGSGGAQRVEGGRISDRISAGEDVPDVGR